MKTRTTKTNKRSASRVLPADPVPAPVKPPFARGNPLTHSVTFTDGSGTSWLVYVEPAPPARALWPNAAVLPGRRLRFDSLEVSVTTAPFPAGAPFLREHTLQQLLDRALSTGTPRHPDTHRGPGDRHHAATPADPIVEPLRDQLSSVVGAGGGWSHRLSRLLGPTSLLLAVVRELIIPRGRG